MLDQPFKEITKSRYLYLLGAVPPARTIGKPFDSGFFLGEAYYNNHHTICVKMGDLYYEARKSILSKTSDLYEDFQNDKNKEILEKIREEHKGYNLAFTPATFPKNNITLYRRDGYNYHASSPVSGMIFIKYEILT